MKKNIIWQLTIIAASVVAILSFLAYIRLQRENNVLNKALASAKQSLDKAAQAVVDLQKENLSIKDELSKTAQENKSILAEMGQTRQMLTIKTGELDAAKKALKEMEENKKGLLNQVNSLSLEKETLRSQILALTNETQDLRRRLNSLKELKIAIRDIKQKQIKDKILTLKETDAKNFKEGNRGYVVKDGKSMLGYKKTVKVLPAPLETIGTQRGK